MKAQGIPAKIMRKGFPDPGLRIGHELRDGTLLSADYRLTDYQRDRDLCKYELVEVRRLEHRE